MRGIRQAGQSASRARQQAQQRPPQEATPSGSFDVELPAAAALARAARAPHTRPVWHAPRKPHARRRGAQPERGTSPTDGQETHHG